MAKNAHPSFEVATIRPSDPNDQSSGFHLSGNRIFIENESVATMLVVAYGVQEKQIVDGPAWLSEHLDVHGMPDKPGAPEFSQVREMIQKLLAERFALKLHSDKRDLPIYVLSAVKGGTAIQPSKSSLGLLNDETGGGNGHGRFMQYTNESMELFAKSLQSEVDRPVVDKTDLTGRYDFKLEWKPDLAPTEENDTPGIFGALQQQLGLKLTADHGLADVLVIDHIERPSDN
jgi:uncharacterized protein (TIGR03435 family)